jgi:hypothetical protein
MPTLTYRPTVLKNETSNLISIPVYLMVAQTGTFAMPVVRAAGIPLRESSRGSAPGRMSKMMMTNLSRIGWACEVADLVVRYQPFIVLLEN